MKWGEFNFEKDDVRVSGVGCCYCGARIATTRIDPVTIDLTANDEQVSQMLWAHARCLRASRMTDLRDEFYEEDEHFANPS